ncbi:response regulator transcription factor [Isobaculum melis]|uniref:Two-component system, OmpR family, response regulator VanR n=1 Tax=Isobaculum melis TaxID=142588 RepID=A0A1H9PY97_9LACT|nr:response regulator transcription factor [Isobaculum melis]SER53276.1 two-component system, OmpR family, response regulator VanR [Isobaculum melis]
MKKILFVDDNEEYRLFFKELLIVYHYDVTVASSASEGLEMYKTEFFDLIISDLKMTIIDGLQFLYLIRKMDENAKVILLTSSDEDEDEVKGLELNANDYIKKSASIKVLLKRIEKVLNESIVFETAELRSSAENIKIDLKTRKVYKNEEEVSLTLKEFSILVLFLRNKNIVLSRELMIKEVWRTNDEFVDIRIIDTHVKRIRAKLFVNCIFSIRGVGYEWVE